MKYLINISIIWTLILFIIFGCDESYLDRNHPGNLTWGTIYNTRGDFEATLNGCYQSIRGIASRNVYLGDIPSDNVYISRYQPSGPLADLDKLYIDARNGELSAYWSDNYTTIQRVNLLLDRIADADIDEQAKKVIIAEALFLRAYAHFCLVRVFGDVPMYDKWPKQQDIYETPRSPSSDVLALVVSDLNESTNIDSYRTSEQRAQSGGKVTTVAAKSLLGKVYLWKKDFENAENTLSDVVDNSGLSLVELSDLYDPDNPFNNEIIFSINYDRSVGFGSPFLSTLTPYNAPEGSVYPNIPGPTGSGYGLIEPYTVSKYLPFDKRKTELIDTLIFENLGIVDTNIFSLKYVDVEATFNGSSGSNTIILRYADVLLMYAEALNMNGKTDQAYRYINQVRNRAGVENLPDGYSKSQMFQALADERQKEFLLEGDRWFDLKFRGIEFLKSEMNEYIPSAYLEQNKIIEVKDHYILFPIPESQIEIKQILEQNAGY